MRNTIKMHNDFITPRDGPSARCAYFLIKIKPAKFPDDPRYGIITTKKTLKYAVDRNRAKRLLRDWLRFNEKLMSPEFDYIFIVRNEILDASREDGRTAMAKALHYLQKTYEK